MVREEIIESEIHAEGKKGREESASDPKYFYLSGFAALVSDLTSALARNTWRWRGGQEDRRSGWENIVAEQERGGGGGKGREEVVKCAVRVSEQDEGK